jgi:hypothetical protein
MGYEIVAGLLFVAGALMLHASRRPDPAVMAARHRGTRRS